MAEKRPSQDGQYFFHGLTSLVAFALALAILSVWSSFIAAYVPMPGQLVLGFTAALATAFGFLSLYRFGEVGHAIRTDQQDHF